MSYISIFFVFTGLLPQIVQCLKQQQQNLKIFGLSALHEIVKHNEELAQEIVPIPTLPHVIHFLSPNFTDVKVQVNFA